MGKKKKNNGIVHPNSNHSLNMNSYIPQTNLGYLPDDQSSFRSSSSGDGYHYNNAQRAPQEGHSTFMRTHRNTPSSELLRELPSRNMDTIIADGSLVSDGGPCDGMSTVRSKYNTMRKADAKFATLRLKSGTVNIFRRPMDVDQVYELLTKDTEMSLGEMKETLRDMNQCLTLKREVSQRLSKSEKKRTRNLSITKWIKYTVSMGFQQLKYSMMDILYSLDLWRSELKIIQGHFGNGIASYFLFLRWLFLLNCFLFFILFSFIVIPQLLWDAKMYAPSSDDEETIAFNGLEIITGAGYFSNTTLYYGHYTSEFISLDDRHKYDMRLAYFMSMAFYLVLSLITVSYSLAKSYRENYIETAGDLKNVFANKVFSAWDYSIETARAAHLHSRSIYSEFKDLLSRQKHEEAIRTVQDLLRLFLIRLLTNAIVLGIQCGTGYLTYYLLDRNSFQTDKAVVKEMSLAMVVTAIIFVIPIFFPVLSSHESYSSSQKELYVNMFRIVLLKVAVLGVVVYFWLFGKADADKCWESRLGQEVYRLFFTHFAFVILYTLFGEFLYSFVARKKSYKKPQFDIARNTLDLVYAQTLAWVGAFFSPLLPLVATVKLFVIFHVKRISLMVNCDPASKVWKAAQIQTMFLVLTLFNFILAAASVMVTVFYRKPSQTCGPFRNETENHYGIILEYLNYDSKGVFANIISFIFSTPSVFGYLIIMCVIIHNMRASANARKMMVNLLRDQVTMEGKDKAYLLKLYDMVVAQRKLSVLQPRTDVESQGEGARQANNQVTDPRGSLPEENAKNSDNSKPKGLVNEHYRDHSLHWSEIGNLDHVPHSVKNPGYMPAEVPVNSNNIAEPHNLPKPGWRSPPLEEPFHRNQNEMWHREPMPKPDYERHYSDDSSHHNERRQSSEASPQLQPKHPLNREWHRYQSGSQSDTESNYSAHKDRRPSKFPPLPQPTHQLGFQYLTRDGESPPFTPRSLRNNNSPVRDSPSRRLGGRRY